VRVRGGVGPIVRIAIALACLGVFVQEASAGSDRRHEPYKASAVNLVVPGGAFREGHVRWDRAKRVLDSPPVAYRTVDGMTIYVSFSDSYTPDPTAAQTYVNLLGSYTHNREMNGLRLSIYTPAEIGATCGANALACYGSDQMFVAGTQVVGAPPIEQVLAHEYGHHIASHRLNPPWPAGDWGPKHWANRMNVCKYSAAGLMFPGDEGDHYAQNPAEGWAEGYRKMIQTNLGWPDIGWNIVDDYFNPEPGELQLINLDVTRPWQHASRYIDNGKLKRRGVRRYKRYLYDGPVTARVTGARGTTVSLSVGGKVVRGPARRVSAVNCGLESLTVVVRSKFGGRYHLVETQDDEDG
jgi:hypothetical protein